MRVLALTSSLLLAGCGSSAPSSVSQQYVPARAHVPPCTHAARAVRLPAHFPPQFPFPTGTTITRTGPLPHGVLGVGVYGFVPSSTFAGTVHYFPREVAKAGFKVLAVEVDSPHDSEGTYRGHGYAGRWALQSIPGCRAMHIGVSAVRAGPGHAA